jgi:hypothetical protein
MRNEHTKYIFDKLKHCNIYIVTININNKSKNEIIHSILKVINVEQPNIVVPDNVNNACMSIYWAKKVGIKFAIIMRGDALSHWNRFNEFVVGSGECRMNGVVTVSRELFEAVQPKIPDSIKLMYCPSSVHLPAAQAKWQDETFHPKLIDLNTLALHFFLHNLLFLFTIPSIQVVIKLHPTGGGNHGQEKVQERACCG